MSSGVLQSESIRNGYWNGYVRCDPAVGQTPNDKMSAWMGLYTEFGRDVVIISYYGRNFGLTAISGARRLGVACERISHSWVNGSSSESRDETRIRLPI